MGLAMPVGPDEVDHRATYRAGAWIAADEEAGQGQPADRMGDGDREARRAQSRGNADRDGGTGGAAPEGGR